VTNAIAQIDEISSAARIAKHWIGGQWCDSADHRDSINPATGEKIGVYALGKEDEAAAAVAAAVRMFRETDWRTNRELRTRVLNEMADRFQACAAQLAEALAAEVGKVPARLAALYSPAESDSSQSNAVQRRGMQNGAATFSYHLVIDPNRRCRACRERPWLLRARVCYASRFGQLAARERLISANDFLIRSHS
jgi:hypothetical protein